MCWGAGGEGVVIKQWFDFNAPLHLLAIYLLFSTLFSPLYMFEMQSLIFSINQILLGGGWREGKWWLLKILWMRKREFYLGNQHWNLLVTFTVTSYLHANFKVSLLEGTMKRTALRGCIARAWLRVKSTKQVFLECLCLP